MNSTKPAADRQHLDSLEDLYGKPISTYTAQDALDDGMQCNHCGGPLILMGRLGRLLHYCCQGCGLWWSRKSKAKNLQLYEND